MFDWAYLFNFDLIIVRTIWKPILFQIFWYFDVWCAVVLNTIKYDLLMWKEKSNFSFWQCGILFIVKMMPLVQLELFDWLLFYNNLSKNIRFIFFYKLFWITYFYDFSDSRAGFETSLSKKYWLNEIFKNT